MIFVVFTGLAAETFLTFLWCVCVVAGVELAESQRLDRYGIVFLYGALCVYV